MPRKILPRIAAVSAGAKSMTLRIRWDRGDESVVDVSGLIETFRVYEPLRHSRELFRQARPGEHGTDVVWNGEIDMAALTLGGWRRNNRGSPCRPRRSGIGANATPIRSKPRRALGVSRRTIAYYEQGAKPVPRVVALAARALEPACCKGQPSQSTLTTLLVPTRSSVTRRAVTRGARVLPGPWSKSTMPASCSFLSVRERLETAR